MPTRFAGRSDRNTLPPCRAKRWAIIGAVLLVATARFGEVRAASDCPTPIARIVAIEGVVTVRRSGHDDWKSIRNDDTLCTGDIVQVGSRSRAAMRFSNETLVRLDQRTTLSFGSTSDPQPSLFDLILGRLHIITRTPRPYRIHTPFVNGNVEGTEFYVEVDKAEARIGMFEGRLTARNDRGSLTLSDDEAMAAGANAPPRKDPSVRPRASVQWTLYYPPIVDFGVAAMAPSARNAQAVREAIALHRTGRTADAVELLEAVEADGSAGMDVSILKAALLLSVGRKDEAGPVLAGVLAADPGNVTALSLRSIASLVDNDGSGALDLAQEAVRLDPDGVAAGLALSYAQQGLLGIDRAMESAKRVHGAHPESALATARLAELYLSSGDPAAASKAAAKASALDPTLEKPLTVLGFASLARANADDARRAFESAILLAPGAPMPRLGLGLAFVKQGDLERGRRELELAVSLDPTDSLLRSYLGKAYYDEKRFKLANVQYGLAKVMDPNDPTPWFYDAILQDALNKPVAALREIEKSTQLNDNRAVYRSRLLLDQDLAARTAQQARVYADLGFDRLADLESWRSLGADPLNYSAHRYLAESYADKSRHEIARVSELLQSQLMQPINTEPIQPQLAESDLFAARGTGPSRLPYNSFGRLNTRDGPVLLLSGETGRDSTWGDEAVVSGTAGPNSYSLGQYRYRTGGFRVNSDLRQDIDDVFVQRAIGANTNIQAEFKHTESDQGDRRMNFDPTNYQSRFRDLRQDNVGRLGIEAQIAPESIVLVSVSYGDSTVHQSNPTSTTRPFPPLGTAAINTDLLTGTEQRGYLSEIQWLRRLEHSTVRLGLGDYESSRIATNELAFSETLLPPLSRTLLSFDRITQSEGPTRHVNGYAYMDWALLREVTATIGTSFDHFQEQSISLRRDRFNPKLGLSWSPNRDLTIRTVAVKEMKRALTSNQTLEPTGVAGFNQLFDDVNGTLSTRLGIGADIRLSGGLYAGVEVSKRDLSIPLTGSSNVEWGERVASSYLYAVIDDHWVADARVELEEFDHHSFFANDFERMKTIRVPVGTTFFRGPLSLRLRSTAIDQTGLFSDGVAPPAPRTSRFWVTDASVSLKLPGWRALLSLEGRNLFNRKFLYQQDVDFAKPTPAEWEPQRQVFVKLTMYW